MLQQRAVAVPQSHREERKAYGHVTLLAHDITSSAINYGIEMVCAVKKMYDCFTKTGLALQLHV